MVPAQIAVEVFFLLMSCCAVTTPDDELPTTPPGRFCPLQETDHQEAASFERGQPIVGTTYFYWYDIESKSHIIDRDGTDALTTHPADMNDISYKRASWHERQLKDMVAAGLDFLMPVYWGVPGEYKAWSSTGLPPLVSAHDELKSQGLNVPSIGMFYDTSILRHNGFVRDGKRYHVDLTTDFGKQWFYTPVRDFFSLIPPDKWARIDGGPIVFMYAAAFAKKQGPEQFNYIKRRFETQFGVTPFIVKAADWKGPADAIYSWGGAVNGPLIYRQVAALGPGYDHTAVPGRQPLIVERRDGKTYVDRWRKMLALNPSSRPWIMHVETWNEWHEGTDIAHSREYGRSYIVLTRLFADMWRAGTVVEAPSLYAEANAVAWRPGRAQGLEIRPSGGDGVWRMAEVTGTKAVICDVNPFSSDSRYLYFNIDDAFAFDLFDKTVRVCVTYRDAGCTCFGVEYDNVDPKKGRIEGAFRRSGCVTTEDTGRWKTAELTLERCRFANRCNGADLRIVVIGGQMDLAVSKVKVRVMKEQGDRK